MGEVYEAQQENPARRVALKVLAPSLAAHPGSVDRFRREAEVLARLDHPGIIRIFTTSRSGDEPFFFTMQLVRGVSLARLIKDAAPEPAAGTALQPTVAQDDASSENAARPARGLPPLPFCEETPRDPLQSYRADRYGLTVRAGVAIAEALAAAHHE